MSLLHLTFTGFQSGQPICGATREPGGKYAHMIYAPIDNPNYRATVCPECLKAYVGSFEPEELAGMSDDHWVKQMAMKESAK